MYNYKQNKAYLIPKGINDVSSPEKAPQNSPAGKMAVIIKNAVDKYYKENPDTGILKTGTKENED